MMTKLDVITIIGNILTQIDSVLSSPGLDPSSPQWQQLFALRKHLDDLQREIVRSMFQEDDDAFQTAAANIRQQNDQMQRVGAGIAKVASIIQIVSNVASAADQLLGAIK